MKRFISIAFFLCLFISLQAQEVYTTKNIPKVHLQDKTRYGKSVRRKVLSGKTLQDTNDSSVDFLPEQPADP